MGSDEVDEEKGNLVQYQQTIELPDGAIQRNKTIESFLETFCRFFLLFFPE